MLNLNGAGNSPITLENNMKYVYVLQRGEYCEGSHVLCVYSNEDSAFRGLAKEFNNCFDIWKDKTDERYVDNMPEWDSYYNPETDGEDIGFNSGCDIWNVIKRRVYD